MDSNFDIEDFFKEIGLISDNSVYPEVPLEKLNKNDFYPLNSIKNEQKGSNCTDIKELSLKLNQHNEMVKEIERLNIENEKLKKQSISLNESASSVRMMYQKEHTILNDMRNKNEKLYIQLSTLQDHIDNLTKSIENDRYIYEQAIATWEGKWKTVNSLIENLINYSFSVTQQMIDSEMLSTAKRKEITSIKSKLVKNNYIVPDLKNINLKNKNLNLKTNATEKLNNINLKEENRCFTCLNKNKVDKYTQYFCSSITRAVNTDLVISRSVGFNFPENVESEEKYCEQIIKPNKGNLKTDKPTNYISNQNLDSIKNEQPITLVWKLLGDKLFNLIKNHDITLFEYINSRATFLHQAIITKKDKEEKNVGYLYSERETVAISPTSDYSETQFSGDSGDDYLRIKPETFFEDSPYDKEICSKPLSIINKSNVSLPRKRNESKPLCTSDDNYLKNTQNIKDDNNLKNIKKIEDNSFSSLINGINVIKNKNSIQNCSNRCSTNNTNILSKNENNEKWDTSLKDILFDLSESSDEEEFVQSISKPNSNCVEEIVLPKNKLLKARNDIKNSCQDISKEKCSNYIIDEVNFETKDLKYENKKISVFPVQNESNITLNLGNLLQKNSKNNFSSINENCIPNFSPTIKKNQEISQYNNLPKITATTETKNEFKDVSKIINQTLQQIEKVAIEKSCSQNKVFLEKLHMKKHLSVENNVDEKLIDEPLLNKTRKLSESDTSDHSMVSEKFSLSDSSDFFSDTSDSVKSELELSSNYDFEKKLNEFNDFEHKVNGDVLKEEKNLNTEKSVKLLLKNTFENSSDSDSLGEVSNFKEGLLLNSDQKIDELNSKTLVENPKKIDNLFSDLFGDNECKSSESSTDLSTSHLSKNKTFEYFNGNSPLVNNLHNDLYLSSSDESSYDINLNSHINKSNETNKSNSKNYVQASSEKIPLKNKRKLFSCSSTPKFVKRTCCFEQIQNKNLENYSTNSLINTNNENKISNNYLKFGKKQAEEDSASNKVSFECILKNPKSNDKLLSLENIGDKNDQPNLNYDEQLSNLKLQKKSDRIVLRRSLRKIPLVSNIFRAKEKLKIEYSVNQISENAVDEVLKLFPKVKPMRKVRNAKLLHAKNIIKKTDINLNKSLTENKTKLPNELIKSTNSQDMEIQLENCKNKYENEELKKQNKIGEKSVLQNLKNSSCIEVISEMKNEFNPPLEDISKHRNSEQNKKMRHHQKLSQHILKELKSPNKINFTDNFIVEINLPDSNEMKEISLTNTELTKSTEKLIEECLDESTANINYFNLNKEIRISVENSVTKSEGSKINEMGNYSFDTRSKNEIITCTKINDSPVSPILNCDSIKNVPVLIPLERNSAFLVSSLLHFNPGSKISKLNGECSTINIPLPSRKLLQNKRIQNPIKKNGSVVENLLQAFNPLHQEKIFDKNNLKKKKLKMETLTKLKNILYYYIDSPANTEQVKICIFRLLQITKVSKLICKAIIDIIEISKDKAKITFTELSETEGKIIVLTNKFNCHIKEFKQNIITEIHSKIFTLKTNKIPLANLMNLIKFNILVMELQNSNTNEDDRKTARLLIFKCFYYYHVKAIPIVFQLLISYPSVLPRKKNPFYNDSDPIIKTIQSILNCTPFNMAKIDLRHHEMFYLLKDFYNYERVKPSREELIDFLLRNIIKNNFEDISISFALICKYHGVEWAENFVIEQKILPLLNEYYIKIFDTHLNDKNIECIFESLSYILKTFPLDFKNFEKYLQIFKTFLFATNRKCVQQAAVSAILRTSRFGLVNTFTAILNWKPDFKVDYLVDVDKTLLQLHINRINPLLADHLKRREVPLKVEVYQGSIDSPNDVLKHADAVLAIEIIEHLYPDVLENVPYNIFGFIQPKTAIFTTPNSEFNILFDLTLPNGMRHLDHKFEWTRAQFKDWCQNICLRFPKYVVSVFGIGSGPPIEKKVGKVSQIAVFIRKDMVNIEIPIEKECYIMHLKSTDILSDVIKEYNLIQSVDYPFYEDKRTKNEKILDEAKYHINDCLNKEFYRKQIDNIEKCIIPIEEIFFYTKNFSNSIKKLTEILENHNYKIESNNIIIDLNEEYARYEDDTSELLYGPDHDYINNEKDENFSETLAHETIGKNEENLTDNVSTISELWD